MQYLDDLPEHVLNLLALFKMNICRIDILEGIYEIELDGNDSLDLDIITEVMSYPQFRMVSESDTGNLLVFINE